MPDPRRPPWRALPILPALALPVLLVLALVPLAPSMPALPQDSACQYAVNQAVADGLAFGRALIFNLGPLAALYDGQFHPATDRLMLGGDALLALGFAAGLAALARGWRRWLVLLVPLLIAGIGLRDPAFLAAPMLLLAVAAALARRDGAPGGGLAVLALVLLTAGCALLPLVKATFGTEAVVLAALAAAALALGRRFWLAALLPVVFVASMIGGWRAAGQPLDALADYLGTIRLLIAGYTEGGALEGPPAEIFAYLAAALLLALPLGWGWWRRRARGVDLVLGLGVAFTLFVAFKAGFVRHDVHAMIAVGTLALLPPLLVRELSAAGLALAVPASLAALAYVGGHYAYGVSPAQGAARLVQAARGGAARWADPAALDRGFLADLAALRAAAPLPQVAGPSDIYSTGHSALLANGLSWSPRPALQSLTAYSAALSRADRDHLLGTPVRNVFLRVENDDNRFRALEDGLSWPGLLSAYTLRGFDARQDTVWLERRAGAVAAAPDARPFFAGQFAVGAAVPLPMLAAAPAGLVWATIELRPTLLGRLAALLFRPPILSLTLADADGRGERFRLLSSLAGAGFVLAPVVRDTTGFAMLALPERAAPRYRPATLMLSGSSGTRLLWARTFGLTLHTLSIPPQPQARRLVLTPLAAPDPALADAAEAGAAPDCALDAVDDRAPRAAPLDVGGSLRVRGWAAVPGGRGAATDRLFIRLAGADGRAAFAATRPVARPDVAQHFGRPDLVDPGFEAAIDLGDLAGPATLAVEVLRDGRRWTCAVQQRLLIAAPAPAQPVVGAGAMP